MKIKAYSYLKSQEMYAKTASAQPEASVQPRAGPSSTEARRRSTDSCPGPLPTCGRGGGRGKERQEWGCPVLSFALRSLTPHFQTLGKEIRTARLPLPTPPATRAVPPARAAGAPRRARGSPAAAPRTTTPGLCISSTWREAWRTLTETGPRPLTPKL